MRGVVLYFCQIRQNMRFKHFLCRREFSTLQLARGWDVRFSAVAKTPDRFTRPGWTFRTYRWTRTFRTALGATPRTAETIIA